MGKGSSQHSTARQQQMSGGREQSRVRNGGAAEESTAEPRECAMMSERGKMCFRAEFPN
jgi:hypothetical protein